MKIAVLVKEVPDTYGQRHLDLETGLVVRAREDNEAEQVLDEIAERAIELALTLNSATDCGAVELLSMTPASAAATIRKGLAMGADSAIQVVDDALIGADLTLTAEVLAALIRRGEYDLVIAGNLSTDGEAGVIPAMLAEHLDWPLLSQLTTLTNNGNILTGTRASETAAQTLKAELPAIASITEAFPAGRFPNFKGIMAAKKKPFKVLTLADLGIDAEDFSVPRLIMTAVTQAPAREAGIVITDDGTAAAQLADYLAQHGLLKA